MTRTEIWEPLPLDDTCGLLVYYFGRAWFPRGWAWEKMALSTATIRNGDLEATWMRLLRTGRLRRQPLWQVGKGKTQQRYLYQVVDPDQYVQLAE